MPIFSQALAKLDVSVNCVGAMGYPDVLPIFRNMPPNCQLLSVCEPGLCQALEFDDGKLMLANNEDIDQLDYPGTNHIGEYIAWSDEFLASTKIQYFFDPVREHSWETKKTPRFVYDFSSNPTGIDIHDKNLSKDDEYERIFSLKEPKLTRSAEYGIPIVEAIVFDLNRYIPSLNMPNKGTMPGVMEDMCVEGPCIINAQGVHPQKVEPLPTAITAMINTQGAIHRLVIEAYAEKSKNKLLQAMLLDPTISNYNNAVALIDEMCQRQKEILPPMEW